MQKHCPEQVPRNAGDGSLILFNPWWKKGVLLIDHYINNTFYCDSRLMTIKSGDNFP